jgi:Ran GTPase-activating protein (RanGAP) involved in mRNA processing and transport
MSTPITSQESFLLNISNGLDTQVAVSGRNLDDAGFSKVLEAIERGGGRVTAIDASNNAITTVGVCSLIRFLSSNASVREISLDQNQIDETGAQLLLELMIKGSNITLTNVYIDNNPAVSPQTVSRVKEAAGLQGLPAFIKDLILGNVPSPSVDLSAQVGKFSLRTVAQIVAKASDIVELNLAGMDLADAGVESLGEILAPLKELRVLNLTANRIGVHGIKGFVQKACLKTNTSLTRLVLTNNKLPDDAARTLVDLLRVNSTLVDIDVTDNAITAATLAQLNRALLLNRQPLELKKAYISMLDNEGENVEIDFQWSPGMELSASFLGPALKLNTTVVSLNLGNCTLGDEGTADIAASLKFNKTLQRLSLPNNGITSAGAIVLFTALSQNTGLKELNLANNRIDDAGGRELRDVLQRNDNVAIVNLEQNELSDALMSEIDGLVTVNQVPCALKNILPALESDSRSLTAVSFAQYDGCRYFNDVAMRVLSNALYHNTAVTSVDLSHNIVGDLAAPFIAKLLSHNKFIQEFNISFNGLTDRGISIICDALLENDGLKTLNISGNLVGDVSGEAILAMLQKNHSVTQVIMEQTRISHILQNDIKLAGIINSEPLSLKLAIFRLRAKDETFYNLDFSVFDGLRYFTDSSVRLLCQELLNNETVEILNLRDNRFGFEGICALAALVAQGTCTIRTLNVSANLAIDDEAVIELAKGFANNQGLREIDLRGTSVTTAGVIAIAQSLTHNHTIIRIWVDPQNVSPDALEYLAKELAVNTQHIALKALLPAIQENDPNLTSLFIQGDGEGRPFDDVSCQLLSLALSKNRVVTRLDLSNNSITSEGIEYLTDMLEDNQSITHISLSNNRINDEGARLLTKCLEVNHVITQIDLDGNPITEAALTEVFYLLRINSGPFALKRVMVALASDDDSVEALDFSGANAPRKFDDEAIHVLCSLLVDNHRVRAVDLSNNDITDIGASLLADLLRANNTLEALHLDNNCIGVEGAEALFQALKSNHTLYVLTTEGNAIPETTLENLASVLNVNAVHYKPRQNLKNQRDILQTDDHLQFRDTDYLLDKTEEITDQAMRFYPVQKYLPEEERLKPKAIMN